MVVDSHSCQRNGRAFQKIYAHNLNGNVATANDDDDDGCFDGGIFHATTECHAQPEE